MRYSAAEELEIIRLVEQAHLSVRQVTVLGEATPDRPFTDSSPPNPRDSFGVSKWEAEQALSEIASRFKMGVVILRPPLVYGLGVKGHFRSLMRFVDRGVPLPLGSIANRRSSLCLGSLVDAIERCLAHRAAAGRNYLIRDGEDRSTADLLRRRAAALGRKAPAFLPFRKPSRNRPPAVSAAGPRPGGCSIP